MITTLREHVIAMLDARMARGIEAAEQVVAVPRIFYASEQGWAAIQRLLDDEESQQPSADTIS